MDVQSGERTAWKDLQLSDPTGVILVGDPSYTADGAGYAYDYWRTVSSDLYLVEGLK